MSREYRSRGRKISAESSCELCAAAYLLFPKRFGGAQALLRNVILRICDYAFESFNDGINIDERNCHTLIIIRDNFHFASLVFPSVTEVT